MSRSTGTNTFVLALSVAVLAASGTAYGAKAKPAPDINDKVCQAIGGVWTPQTCTIPEGSNGVASSDFKITKPKTLDVRGSLTVDSGVTISNSGTIIVQNVAGVIPAEYGDAGLMAGILVLGALDNSGAINIQNATAGTVGIGVSVSVSENDPPVPNPLLVVPGVLTNSGAITIQNVGDTQGINNLGALNNSASGSITVVNSLPGSVGIRNRREATPVPHYYLNGTVTNAGSMTIANSGGVDGRGLSNAGSFTNSATGTFTLGPSAVADDPAWGLRNNGSFTNYGTFINNRGRLNESDPPGSTWGSYNLSPGAMMNYGRTIVGTPADSAGTFYNESIMINFGEITSHGVLADVYGAMINYGTIYNYGLIGGGANVGICIDEPGSPGGGGC